MKEENNEELIQKIVELEAVKKELTARKLTTNLFEFNKQILQVEGGKDSVPLADFHKELCEFTTNENTNKKLILVPRGHLKALKTEGTRVLTSKGFIPYKELKVGQELIGGDGKPTKVVKVHPKAVMELYKVVTNDGREIVCNEEHLFRTRIRANDKKWKIRTLKWILKRYSKKRLDKRDGKTHYEHSVQLEPVPVYFSKKKLPIDPYTLGMWLGDGNSSGSRMSCAYPEMFGYSEFEWHKVSGKYNYDTHGLQKKLRLANLLGNKYIPQKYFVSSYKQRLELLRGLMDSDGTCHKDGGITYFSNINYRLIEEFVSLTRSLGGVAMVCKVNQKVNGEPYDTWTVSVRLPDNINPFNLKRKAKIFTGLKRELAINIVDIEKVEDDVANCITVESEDGVFIVDDYFPTHNSTLVTVGYSLMRIAQDPTVRILIANATFDMSTSFLGQIKKHIKENEVFKDHYGDYGTNPDRWAENMISIGKRRSFGRKEATVTTYGIGGNLVSQHYDVIIMDDVVNRELINTREQIQKTILFYKDALDLLEPNGKLIIIGTRWSDNDLYGWIMDKTNPEQVWRNFDVMVQQAYSGNLETEENLQLLFPQKFTRDILKTLKMEKGPYEFSCTPEETPILMSDWSLKKISEVKVGDEVVGFTLDKGKKRRLVKSKVKNTFTKKDQVYKLGMKSGKEVLCTKDHRWMTRKSEDETHSLYNVPKIGRKLRCITSVDEVYSPEEISDYRYLAGMIDGDGGCKSGNSIFIHQDDKANPVVWKEIRDTFDRLGVPYTSKDKYLWLNGGAEEREKILRIGKPAKSYQILKSMYGSRFCREVDEIVSMEKEKVRDVYALETETGNYVAWGFGSSNSQYMNDPVPQEDAKFKTEWMKHILEDELRIRDMNYFTMVDPAIGQLKSSDNTAIVTVGVDQWNNWFVVNIILGKMLPNEILDFIFANWEQYKPRKIGIEMTAYQKSLQYSIIDEMRRRNVFLPIVELKADRSKEERIEGLVPRYANGGIYHLQQCPHRGQLEEELMRFPKGKHDDIVDALAYGLQICFPTRSKQPRFSDPEDKRPVKYLY